MPDVLNVLDDFIINCSILRFDDAFWELYLVKGVVGSVTDRKNSLEGHMWEVSCFPPGSSELDGVLPLLLVCFDYFSMPSYSCS